MVVLETCHSYHRFVMKKTAADSKDKRKKKKKKNLDLHAACLFNSFQGKDAVIQTKLLNSSKHWHWM